jgi:hypothetical protein
MSFRTDIGPFVFFTRLCSTSIAPPRIDRASRNDRCSSQAVIRELDGLKRNPLLGHLARAAFGLMERAQSGGSVSQGFMSSSDLGGTGKGHPPARDRSREADGRSADKFAAASRATLDSKDGYKGRDQGESCSPVMRLQKDGEVGTKGERCFVHPVLFRLPG